MLGKIKFYITKSTSLAQNATCYFVEKSKSSITKTIGLVARKTEEFANYVEKRATLKRI